jgi:hypothetical protein
MKTNDGRRIISGFYSTEEDRKKSLTPEQWIKWITTIDHIKCCT